MNKDTCLMIDVLSKVNFFKGDSFVIKLSADLIEDDSKLNFFADQIAILKNLGINIIVIHEHGNLVAQTLDIFGIKETIIDGSKVADHKTVQIMEMVLSGYVNKKITSAICASGVSAIGISGKDANLIEAKKYRMSKKRKDSNIEQIIDMGFVGEPTIINPEILIDLENADVVTVISPIAYGENGNTFLLDVNLTAAIVASAVTATRLFFLDSNGGIKMAGEEVKEISNAELKIIRNNGNFDKQYMNLLDAAISSMENYTEYVHILDSKVDYSILLDLFLDERHGTLIKD